MNDFVLDDYKRYSAKFLRQRLKEKMYGCLFLVLLVARC
jgi:hypothetical protein